MTTRQRVTMIAHGRVQGVFFRDSTRKRALELDLVGTVRNLPDGTVEIVAEGTRESLETLAQWAAHGPPASKVSHLDVTWTPEASGRFKSFEITY